MTAEVFARFLIGGNLLIFVIILRIILILEYRKFGAKRWLNENEKLKKEFYDKEYILKLPWNITHTVSHNLSRNVEIESLPPITLGLIFSYKWTYNQIMKDYEKRRSIFTEKLMQLIEDNLCV